MQQQVKVWDIPTRLFHWSVVSLMGGLWWSADNGEMDWHLILAYLLGALLIFRLIWGVIGSDTARFCQFVKSPAQALQYLKHTRREGISAHRGHNPLGAYMVLALIALLLAQMLMGLFATDGIFTEGPLFAYVSYDTAEQLTWLHKKNFDLILVLVAVHISAVIFHEIKGDHLIGAMITGRRRNVDFAALKPASLWGAVALFAVILLPMAYFFIVPIYQNLY